MLTSLRPMLRLAFALTVVLASGPLRAQYAVGDYGTVANGNWALAATWNTWNGAAWVVPTTMALPATPSVNANVWIRTGFTVFLTCGAAPTNCNNLTVEAGGKLWTQNCGVNTYVGIYGSLLRCNGTIGDGSIFDGISFNIEGANVSVVGTGAFDCSRVRKSTTTPNATTNLVIAMNMNIRFAGGSTTQLYNNAGASSFFNVTVNAGVTVNLVGSTGSGNLAIDGTGGVSAGNAAGSYVVNGTINMNGILYLTTNNTANACSITINNGGLIRCGQVNASASGAATHALTIAAGGRLEIQGSPTAWIAGASNTNNAYTLATASTVEYSGLGTQNVWCGLTGGYGNLRISGSGSKNQDGVLTVRGDLTIANVSGAPTLDVTAANFQANVAGNWTNYNQTGFNERAGLVALNGTAGQTITTAGGERFNNLRLAKSVGTTVTLASDVAVGAQLNFVQGIIDLDQRRLTLENSATTAIIGGAATRYIVSERSDNSSKVQWNIGTTTGAHLVPFGRAAGYLPFTYDLTSGDAGNVTISTYGTAAADNLPWPTLPTLVSNLNGTMGLLPDNSAATVDRFWQIDPTGPNPTATLTFTYLASELPAAPYNQPLLMESQRYSVGTNTWEPAVAGQSPAAFSNVSPGITTWGPYTLAVKTFPLPVELLSFDAVRDGRVVRLDWTTASERDNAFFTVLRSSDGLQFEELSELAGAGNSVEELDYRTFDRSPLPGVNYYRLRQTDLDGTATETGMVAVDMGDQLASLVFHPNPANDLLVLRTTEGAGRVDLVDAQGRLVRSVSLAGSAGPVPVNVSDLGAGLYQLRYSSPSVQRSWPLVIAH